MLQRVLVLGVCLMMAPLWLFGAKLEKAYLSNQQLGTSCSAPPPEVSVFTIRDREVWLFAIVLEATAKDTFRVEWIEPWGKVVKSSTFEPLQSAGNWCFSAALSTTAQPYDFYEQGNWTVRGFWNGVLLFTRSFALRVLPPPSFEARGVVNAASFAPGPVSPGEIITIFGTNLGPKKLVGLQLDSAGKVATSLSKVRILFDGVPAPLIYVQANQISAVVPYLVAGKTQTQVEVEAPDADFLSWAFGEDKIADPVAKSKPVAVPVVESAPGIFTTDSSGRGQAAILNQDWSLNSASRPAPVDSVVMIYATGEGQTEPPGVDGKLAKDILPKPQLPVTVTIGGQAAEVLYAGAAPGLVAGVLQVNARVPKGSASASKVPVVVTVGSRSSQAEVTMAVTTALLQSLTLSAAVSSGNSVTGRVTLTEAAPAGGIVVNLSSNNPAARVPATVTVAGGQTSATFTVTTTVVTAPQVVTLVASYGGVEKTTTLTVNPPSPFASKKRIIVNGTFSGKELQLPLAILLDTALAEKGGFIATVEAGNELKGIYVLIWFEEQRFAENTITFSTLPSPINPSSYTNIGEGFVMDTITSANLTLIFTGPVVNSSVSGKLKFSTRNVTREGAITGQIVIVQ